MLGVNLWKRQTMKAGDPLSFGKLNNATSCERPTYRYEMHLLLLATNGTGAD
jgi:hypothetical protein